MELPRQPDPVKVTITGNHGDDIYRAFLVVKQILENNYASINSRTTDEGCVIDCYPFAVND